MSSIVLSLCLVLEFIAYRKIEKMANQTDVAQMASLMLALTQPDTETIRQAELALKPILKDARSIPALLEVIKARGNYVSFLLRRCT